MPEEVILFLRRSSLSRLGIPLKAASGIEVMAFPRTPKENVLAIEILRPATFDCSSYSSYHFITETP